VDRHKTLQKGKEADIEIELRLIIIEVIQVVQDQTLPEGSFRWTAPAAIWNPLLFCKNPEGHLMHFDPCLAFPEGLFRRV